MCRHHLGNALEKASTAPAEEVGRALSGILEIVFGPISHIADKSRLKYAHKLKQFEKELDVEISTIPQGQRVEPKISTTGRILDDAKYIVEEDSIREFFVKLVASSIDKEKEDKVHPAHSIVLSQMTAHDAMFFKQLCVIKTCYLPSTILEPILMK